MFEELIKRKKVNAAKLSDYGLKSENGKWTYRMKLMSGSFDLTVWISEDGKIDTNLIDTASGEPYVLYKTNAAGAYVGGVRTAIEAVLTDMVNACYDPSVFSSRQAQTVIEFVRKKYGDELEFLWDKFPDNAVWRRKDNGKWYGAILTVSGSKIGLDTDRTVEIIDLRMNPEDRDAVLSQKYYYPGWHMNKKSWYTLVFDNGISDRELKRRIEESHELAWK